MKLPKWALAASLLLALCAAVLTGWLFRRTTVVDPNWGSVTYAWRWGRAYSFTMDRNRDGRIDLRCTVDTGKTFFSPHTQPSDCWIDSTYAGFLDHHVVFAVGEPQTVDVFARNGILTRHLSGESARAYYKALAPFDVAK